MRKVLIVEDDEHVLDLLARAVSEPGYLALTAASFEEGKELIDTAEPDLLVIDVRLGPYNGLHLVIRESISHPARPMILITAFGDPQLAREARRYGAEFLEKPIKTDKLVALIKKLLPDEIPAESV